MWLLLIFFNVEAQQNLQLTQHIFNSLPINPAYAGHKEDWFAQVGLRSQWIDIEGAPRTAMLSVDGLLNPISKRHGVGLNINADFLGAQSATLIYANYALRLAIDEESKHNLALGIAGGVSQYSLDGSKFRLTDPGDPMLPDGPISTWNPDIRLGVYYHNPTWYLGVAVHDLFSNSRSDQDYRFNENSLESLYRNVNIYLTGGARFNLNEGLDIRPSVLIKDDLKGPTTLDINAMLIFDTRFWVGAGYRTRTSMFEREYFDLSAEKLRELRSFQFISQIHVSPRLRLGYSYDVMMNRMSTYNGGVHEVTLGISFGGGSNQTSGATYF